VTTPETVLIKSYKRETVEKVYELIEKDFLEALEHITSKFYKNTGKYHFGKESCLAFASRFYLYKNDFKKCIEYSNQLLGTTYNPLFTKDYSKVLAGQGPKGVANIFSSTSDQSNLLIVRKNLGYQLYYRFGYRMTQDIATSLYIGLRYGLDYRGRNMWVGNEDNSAMYQAKFESLFKRTSLTSASGLPYTVHAVFRGEEVLFNKLESMAELMLNQTNEDLQREMRSEIVSFLNSYIPSRYIGKKGGGHYNVYELGSLSVKYAKFLSLTADKKAYYVSDSTNYIASFVKDEKRREFAEEGLRWFDIKRQNLSIQHKTDNGQTIVLDSNDTRKIIQLPSNAIANGLKAN
jgi:hypothetical protein